MQLLVKCFATYFVNMFTGRVPARQPQFLPGRQDVCQTARMRAEQPEYVSGSQNACRAARMHAIANPVSRMPTAPTAPAATSPSRAAPSASASSAGGRGGSVGRALGGGSVDSNGGNRLRRPAVPARQLPPPPMIEPACVRNSGRYFRPYIFIQASLRLFQPHAG